MRGRGGNDRLTMLGSLPVRYEGGDGDDAYVAATRPGVPTAVDFSGGGDPGDLADYSRAEVGIDVRKNDRPNDGRFSVGDKDNIRTDVTMVRGTRFRDILHGQTQFATFETIQPQGGDDFVLGLSGVTVVDMGAAPDGADKIRGRRSRPSGTRTAPTDPRDVDLGGADDGEAGEGDELQQVGDVIRRHRRRHDPSPRTDRWLPASTAARHRHLEGAKPATYLTGGAGTRHAQGAAARTR